MALSIHVRQAGAQLGEGEMELLARGAREQGRATLLVPNRAERELCRQALAQADGGSLAGTGIDVNTPAAWVEGLWELFGDGRRIVGRIERRMIMGALVADRDEEDLAPLRDNPGTLRLLARIAKDLLPYATSPDAPAAASEAEQRVRGLLSAYGRRLKERGLVEASQAAELLGRSFAGRLPACARFVCLRDLEQLPAWELRLLAAIGRGDGQVEGELHWLCEPDEESFVRQAAEEMGAAGCETLQGEALGGAGAGADGAAADGARRVGPEPEFLEVSGPHAKAAAYAAEVKCLLDDAREGGAQTEDASVVVACPLPAELFGQLAPRLAAKGISSSAERWLGWSDTLVGQQFTALLDLAERMGRAGDELLHAQEWWPAPELSDWLYSPLSGADARSARDFDKKLRSQRVLSPEDVQRELADIQERQRAARGAPDAQGDADAPAAVCADVFLALRQGRYVDALSDMLATAQAQPARAFGSRDGRARKQAECSMARRAIEVLEATAAQLEVPQETALAALGELSVKASLSCAPGEDDAGADAGGDAQGDAAAPADVRFLTLQQATLLPAGSVGGLLLADVDVDSYPLKHDQGLAADLAARLDASPLSLEPADAQRLEFSRALALPSGRAVLARVARDGQADERYPAAIWTELWRGMERPEERRRRVGEECFARDFDPAEGRGLRREQVECLPPQRIDEAALPYLLPPRLDRDDPEAAPQPYRFSPSQIEKYLSCPLCWFIDSRVKPDDIDAGFGPLEKGNLVHDVMQRFHERLPEIDAKRVTEENLMECLELLRKTFFELRDEHARGLRDGEPSDSALVPHSTLEDLVADEILEDLVEALFYEAEALPPFHPELSEFDFAAQDVDYAGQPLGGRIDRVDFDAERRRAVVIDYKYSGNAKQYLIKDPSVRKRDGSAPADDPDWLPEHVQTLIYAQALRRLDEKVEPRAGIYFVVKGRDPAMRGAVSAELVDMVPGLKGTDGLPAEDEKNASKDGSMGFEELLNRVEFVVMQRLGALAAGDIRASKGKGRNCERCHALGFERRQA